MRFPLILLGTLAGIGAGFTLLGVERCLWPEEDAVAAETPMPLPHWKVTQEPIVDPVPPPLPTVFEGPEETIEPPSTPPPRKQLKHHAAVVQEFGPNGAPILY
jgi:NADPH-dependent 2,4-dienoyl-CoA reductase/sulfur reductase-like enzyme